MLSYKGWLLFFGGFCLLTIRCVREASVELPEVARKIVAISHFSPGKPIRVEVSLSQSLTDAGDPEIPSNADVSIAIEGKFLDKLFRQTDDAGRIYWESRDLVQPDVKYALSVRIAGLDQVEGLSSAPEPVPLQSIRIDTTDMRLVPLSDGKLAYRVPLEIRLPDDLPGENRYFAFGLQHEIEAFEVVNGEQVPDEYYQGATKFLADGRTLALVYDTPEGVVLVNSNFWSAGNRLLNLDALIPFNPDNERPRRLFVEWRTLSEEFYKYHLSVARQGNNLPLNDPDALYNNIQGGYGNFSGFSFLADTLALPNPF